MEALAKESPISANTENTKIIYDVVYAYLEWGEMLSGDPDMKLVLRLESCEYVIYTVAYMDRLRQKKETSMSKAVDRYAQKDKQLFSEVQKLMDGNFESYQNVYELSKNYIYKVIYDIVQDHYTTEDMMQETYLQVYNKIGSLREAKAFYVWAGRIASNLTLRYLQKYHHEVLTEATDDDGEDFIFDKMVNDNEAFIPESVLENQEQQRIIAGILESLSPEQKLTVQYFYYEEMSVNDIASLMECSTGTVKSRLNYARKSLKTAISQFETDNNVKLYSLSSMPIFFLVFKDLSETLALAVGTAGAAGAAAAAGSAGAAVSGGGAAAAGSVGGAGAAGFLGTVAGKAAIVAAVAVVGGAAIFAVTQSLENEASNVVETEFDIPWVIAGDPEVQCVTEELEVESGDDCDRRIKYTYYEMEGNLLLYEICEWAVGECGHMHQKCSNYYYTDDTPWYMSDYSNYVHEDYPQYGWYGAESYTYTTHAIGYDSNGSIRTNYSYVYVQMDDGGGVDLSRTSYNDDGSIESYIEYDDFMEVANNQWVYAKATSYDADGSVKEYYTYEYDENGKRIKTNTYNPDGTPLN